MTLIVAKKITDKEMYKLRKLMNSSQLIAIHEKWNQNTRSVDKPRFNYLVELLSGIALNTTLV